MSRNLLIFICVFLVVAFSVAYADLYHKYKEERMFRIWVQAFSEYYEQDADHYRQLYYDCLNQDKDSSGERLAPAPWSGK